MRGFEPGFSSWSLFITSVFCLDTSYKICLRRTGFKPSKLKTRLPESYPQTFLSRILRLARTLRSSSRCMSKPQGLITESDLLSSIIIACKPESSRDIDYADGISFQLNVHCA